MSRGARPLLVANLWPLCYKYRMAHQHTGATYKQEFIRAQEVRTMVKLVLSILGTTGALVLASKLLPERELVPEE
jgi:hypothetical protein